MNDILNEAWGVITDPGHVLAEMIFITIEAAIISPFIAWAIRRHDKRVHSK